MHWGVDYGSKKAGTTVVAYENDWGKLCLRQSEKNKDADEFCLQLARELEPEVIFIDAPLTLPLIYHKAEIEPEGGSYFYRKCDRDLAAMSPMFLGGLTARAMYLKSRFKKQSKIKVIETYPSALIAELHLKEKGYDKRKGASKDFWPNLKRELPVKVEKDPTNWHQIDALLAWYSGWRFFKARAKSFGDPDEGVIWV